MSSRANRRENQEPKKTEEPTPRKLTTLLVFFSPIPPCPFFVPEVFSSRAIR